MEKVKVFGISFLIFLSLSVSAQTSAEKPPIVRAGLIRAYATLTPSYLFSQKQAYFYLHGNLEGYLSNKISIAGESYFGLGSIGGKNHFNHNHSVYFGANIHYVNKNNDLFIGLQPGLSVTQLKETETKLSKSTFGFNPLVSISGGYNFYVNKIFHFFVQMRYSYGKHLYDVQTNLGEIKLSAGLGFNLNTMKPKKN